MDKSRHKFKVKEIQLYIKVIMNHKIEFTPKERDMLVWTKKEKGKVVKKEIVR